MLFITLYIDNIKIIKFKIICVILIFYYIHLMKLFIKFYQLASNSVYIIYEK